MKARMRKFKKMKELFHKGADNLTGSEYRRFSAYAWRFHRPKMQDNLRQLKHDAQ